MRSTLLLCLFLLFQVSSGLAQNRAGATPAFRDGVYLQNGKVMRMQGGKASPLLTPVTMENGLVVNPDGNLVGRDGTRQQLREGQAVNQQGLVVRFSDDMRSEEAIRARRQQVTGETETRIALPGYGTVPSSLTTKLLRAEQRLDFLQQAAALLAERAAATAGSAPGTAPIDAQLRDLDAQLRR
ncbi:DUF3659 domain-containing protein [Hymenobacter sp. BT175]|uniref:DUF3659 domain-containing protein n=1 Tax=Hymenobacter translucens TaxID=2886507 RepID=UPI001D0E97F4|nr:DUF3659 domain-containing protein [Hymenobacter translucens]MCC2546166.1 DUF3659 domain-containing protein [Hymenobacter translucens]